jgi:transposase
VQSRRGQHVAVVATARELAILIWHPLTKGESYFWGRPVLHAKSCAISSSKPGGRAVRGQKGTALAYNLRSHREQERRWVEQVPL